MVKIKTLFNSCIFLLFMLTLFSGTALANPLCTPPCHHSTACAFNTSVADFENFSPTTYAHNGEVCHPNENFKFYVTTSAFGSTTSGYAIVSIPGSNPPVHFVSGHPYYKIEFINAFHPDNVSGITGAVQLRLINDYISTDPIVYIKAFDKNNNTIFNEQLTKANVGLGEEFTISFFVDIEVSNISYMHITTEDKYGLMGIIFFPLPF